MPKPADPISPLAASVALTLPKGCTAGLTPGAAAVLAAHGLSISSREGSTAALPLETQLLHIIRGIGTVSEVAANAPPAPQWQGTHDRPIRDFDDHLGTGTQAGLLVFPDPDTVGDEGSET